MERVALWVMRPVASTCRAHAITVFARTSKPPHCRCTISIGTPLSGRLSGKALRPGRYLLVGVAQDAAANQSEPVQGAFRILPR
jgi:hypothetical protein